MPFHRCSNATEFTSTSDFLNIRFGEEGDACHYLEFCCDPEDVVVEMIQEKISLNEIPSQTGSDLIVTTEREITPATVEGTGSPIVAPPTENENLGNIAPYGDLTNSPIASQIDAIIDDAKRCNFECVVETKTDEAPAQEMIEIPSRLNVSRITCHMRFALNCLTSDLNDLLKVPLITCKFPIDLR